MSKVKEELHKLHNGWCRPTDPTTDATDDKIRWNRRIDWKVIHHWKTIYFSWTRRVSSVSSCADGATVLVRNSRVGAVRLDSPRSSTSTPWMNKIPLFILVYIGIPVQYQLAPYSTETTKQKSTSIYVTTIRLWTFRYSLRSAGESLKQINWAIDHQWVSQSECCR